MTPTLPTRTFQQTSPREALPSLESGTAVERQILEDNMARLTMSISHVNYGKLACVEGGRKGKRETKCSTCPFFAVQLGLSSKSVQYNTLHAYNRFYVYLFRFNKPSMYLFVSTPMPCANFPGPDVQLESAFATKEPLTNLPADLAAT